MRLLWPNTALPLVLWRHVKWTMYCTQRTLRSCVPRLPSYGIYISQLVRFARFCTSVLDFHSKNLQITSKLLTHGYRYHKLRKTFGKFFRSYSELLSKFGDISFTEYLSKGISQLVFYGDLVYKLRRIKDTPNFISVLPCDFGTACPL